MELVNLLSSEKNQAANVIAEAKRVFGNNTKNDQAKDGSLTVVKEKLTTYCNLHHTLKDRWLLSSHAHCFISLS